jgi:hypothetical protein
MKTRLPLLFIAAALMVGCATSSTRVSAPYLTVLQQRGVDPGTYTRISHGRVLTYDDIYDLVQKGIPSDKIVDYLKATRAPYIFSQQQINRLATAGAGPTLVKFLETPPTKPNTDGFDNPTTQAFLNSPYWRDPYYMDAGPMQFMFPESWNAGPLAGASGVEEQPMQ